MATKEGISQMTEMSGEVTSENVAVLFEDHNKPEDAIDVKAHVLTASNKSILESFIIQQLPNCYITAEDLLTQTQKSHLPTSEVLQNKFPDTGNIMAGDFSEILTLYFLGSESSETAKKVKKWRFKEDRKKAAPHSDVVIVGCDDYTNPSADDYVICAEAKSKATINKSYHPVTNAIAGYQKDRTGRLARTLTWLREKEIENGTKESIAFYERFTKDNLTTSFAKKYRAVIVIDRTLLDQELIKKMDIPPQNDEFEIIVIGICDLKILYETCFSNALNGINHE